MDNYNKLELNATFRVTLHKNLIEADFTKSLTLIEQRLLYTAISNIPMPIFKKEKGQFVLDANGKKVIENPITELPKFKMSVKEFSLLLGWKDVDYKKLAKVSGELMSKVITAKAIDNDDPEQFQWVAYTRYMKGTGMVLIELHPRLLPFIANLTENFASVSLGEITNFKSKYSARLFFLLKQWEKAGQKTLSLDEIRKIIGVGFTEKNGKRVYKLDRFFHFNQRALSPAIEEIHQYTDLKISYDEITEGQKIVALNFHIAKKTPQQIQKPDAKKPSAPQPKPEAKPTIYDELAQTMATLNFNKEAYTNIAKQLKLIPNIEGIKGRVTVELNKLASYVVESGNLGPGFVISQVEKAVLSFIETNEFNFDELLKGSKPQLQPKKHSNVRTENVPDWMNKHKEEQAEHFKKKQEKEEERISNIDFEAERAKILAMFGKTEENRHE